MKKSIVLASGSPWRKRLLLRHCIQCKVHVSEFEEIKKHKTPRSIVLFNAKGKAEAVAKHHHNSIVIGVDTIGVYKGRIIGKPENRREAKNMLKFLSGKTHKVISGLCVIDTATGKKITKAIVTKVIFRKISDDELEDYLDSGHWKGKAGAYAIQGRAKGFVKRVDGDISNVVGLPMDVLKEILKKLL